MAATLGGLLATQVTFIPCFLRIFVGAPFIERMRGNKALWCALSPIMAAVVGVVVNLAVWFGIHTIFHKVWPFVTGPLNSDLPVLASVALCALAISLAANVAMLGLKIDICTTLESAAVVGVVLSAAGIIA